MRIKHLKTAARDNLSAKPRLSKIFSFPRKLLYTILSSSEIKMRDFFHENFAERVVILLNCPKKCLLEESWVGIVGEKAVKLQNVLLIHLTSPLHIRDGRVRFL